MRENKVKLWSVGNIKWYRVTHIQDGERNSGGGTHETQRLLQKERSISRFPLLGTEGTETATRACSPNAVLVTHPAEVSKGS